MLTIKDTDVRDLKDMIISALRYALGRRTYITSETAEFIKRYPELIDERVKSVMLRDLEEYFQKRESFKFDDECDFNTWKNLYSWLEEIDPNENKGNCLNGEIEILKPEKKIMLKNLGLSETEKKKYRLIEMDIYDANVDDFIPRVLCLLKGDAKKCKWSEIDPSHVNCFFDHNGELHFCCKPESINWNDVIYLIYNLTKDGLITEY